MKQLKLVQVSMSVLHISDQQNKNERTAITEAAYETMDDKHCF